MTRRCATCWFDSTIAHWRDPDGIRPRGTSESNWICDRCQSKPQNRHWRTAPACEIYGTEHEDAETIRPEPQSDSSHYETPMCLEIMRLYCWGESQRKIASKTGASLKYVSLTIRHWTTHSGYFVGEVRRLLSSKKTAV